MKWGPSVKNNRTISAIELEATSIVVDIILTSQRSDTFCFTGRYICYFCFFTQNQ